MPNLSYPSNATLATWGIQWDHGVKDASTLTNEIGVDMNTGRRKALVNWSNRSEFVDYVLGKSAIWDNAGTLTLTRLLPRTFPGKDWLIATKCTSISGIGTPGWTAGDANQTWNGTANWAQAAVEFLYEQAPYDRLEDANTTSELDRYVQYPAGDPEAVGDALQLPGAAFKYTAVANVTPANSVLVGTSIPFNIAKIVPSERFIVTWHRLPFEDVWNDTSPLYQRIYGTTEGDDVPFMGCVNTTEIFGKPVGTVLFEKPLPKKRAGIDGEFELDLSYQFHYKPSGWNWVYGYRMGNDVANNSWYPATANGTYGNAATAGDHNTIHNGRDLNLLFSVD